MARRRRSTKSRRGRATQAAAAEADALISLPQEILDDILSRLGTATPSARRRYPAPGDAGGESLPSLDLCFPGDGDGDGDGEGAPEGLGAVDGILLRFPGRVRLFSADLNDIYAGRIHDWLCVLSRRDIRILRLSFGDGFPALPSSVFSCGRLTSLILCGCSISVPLLPPRLRGLPGAKETSSKKVRLQEYGECQLEEIIDTSPLLESLHLIDVLIGGAHDRKWVIRAPNLKRFALCSKNNDGWILKELTSLDFALVSLSDFLVHHNFANFLSGLAQVTDLLVATCNIQVFDVGEQEFEVFDVGEQEFEANGEFLNALWTDGMCANLQVVQMIGINWRPNEMSFIELILSKARFLHTLSIGQGDKLVMSNEDALYELLRYRRASAEAQVLFEGKTEDHD